jgi:hypothetical protein
MDVGMYLVICSCRLVYTTSRLWHCLKWQDDYNTYVPWDIIAKLILTARHTSKFNNNNMYLKTQLSGWQWVPVPRDIIAKLTIANM